MARQGLLIYNPKNHLGRVFILAVLFLVFCVAHSWAACETGTYTVRVEDHAYNKCDDGSLCDDVISSCDDVMTVDGVTYTDLQRGVCFNNYNYWTFTCGLDGSMSGSSCGTSDKVYCNIQSCVYSTACSDDCSADSLMCIRDGGTWVPSSVEGECGYCDNDTTDVCAESRSQCQSLGGKFEGYKLGDCCSATCDLCGKNSMNRITQLKREQCCDQSMAPPSDSLMCYTPTQSGCGMTTSQFNTTDNDWECRDPNLDAAAMARFLDQCSDKSSSSNQSSSSESSSSSEQSSSSFGSSSSGDGDSGCEECPYLDSILDTLHAIHISVEDIYLCLTNSQICSSLKLDFDDMPVFQFDSAWRKYLQPLLDSTLKVDSNQLKALLHLDTNMLKQLANDTAIMYQLDALGNVVDTSVHSLNDTVRKWFNRIADSIGITSDSLAAHIDSIVRHIPDTILDSIVKYQQFANDNFDSILYGKGKGFSLIDSLIDSAVYYFKASGHYDSVYRKMFADSIGSLHGDLADLPGRNASAIGSALGYGDTASTNLRGDLNGIREAIDGLGDGIGSGVAGALDSAIGSGSGADTAGVAYGWLSDGDALADSIKLGSGFNGIDFASDSVLRDSLENAGFVCTDSTCCIGSRCVEFDSDKKIQDSLTRFVAAYGDTLSQKNSEYLSDSVPGIFQQVKDSLMAWNPVGIFDSTVLSTLGMKIPNTSTCPEHCSKFQVNIPFFFGTQNFTIDYGLCLGRTAFANGNVLSFLRFIIRVVVAFTCISAVMWNAARMKR